MHFLWKKCRQGRRTTCQSATTLLEVRGSKQMAHSVCFSGGTCGHPARSIADEAPRRCEIKRLQGPGPPSAV